MGQMFDIFAETAFQTGAYMGSSTVEEQANAEARFGRDLNGQPGVNYMIQRGTDSETTPDADR